MAPQIGPYQYTLIEDLFQLKATQTKYASAASYTVQSITLIKRNLWIFGSTQAPLNSEGGQLSRGEVQSTSTLNDWARYVDRMNRQDWT